MLVVVVVVGSVLPISFSLSLSLGVGSCLALVAVRGLVWSVCGRQPCELITPLTMVPPMYRPRSDVDKDKATRKNLSCTARSTHELGVLVDLFGLCSLCWFAGFSHGGKRSFRKGLARTIRWDDLREHLSVFGLFVLLLLPCARGHATRKSGDEKRLIHDERNTTKETPQRPPRTTIVITVACPIQESKQRTNERKQRDYIMPKCWSEPNSKDAFVLAVVSVIVTLIAAGVGITVYRVRLSFHQTIWFRCLFFGVHVFFFCERVIAPLLVGSWSPWRLAFSRKGTERNGEGKQMYLVVVRQSPD